VGTERATSTSAEAEGAEIATVVAWLRSGRPGGASAGIDPVRVRRVAAVVERWRAAREELHR
jgi:hypothetical protein